MAAKRITREQVEDKLTIWQQRLDLLHWDIRLRFDLRPEEEDALVEIVRSEFYDRATIRFSAKWSTWTLDGPIGEVGHNLDELLLHELAHVYMRDIDFQVMDDLDGVLGREAHALFTDTFHRKREALVDRIARALYNGWGPA
jgi:hypothetical protein